jgi:RNA polymerase sigma factor (sigma-70 family)
MLSSDRTTRYSAFFRAHHRAVRRYVARRATPDLVDDVVSETFLVAWRRFEAIPNDGLPWLFSTASKCLANQRRGALRGAELIARLGGERNPAAPDEHEAAHRRRALVRAFMLLSDADRELLMLTVWEGLSSGRAAAALGLAPATAHARVYRARKRLRRALAAELDDDDAAPATVPRSARETA